MPDAVIETVSAPNGSAGDSRPAAAVPRGLRALAPMLPGAGPLPATPGCSVVTVALCTSWPCTRGVRVVSPPPQPRSPPLPSIRCRSLSLAGSERGTTLIAGFGARVGKSSFIWSGFFPPHAARRRARRADREEEPRLGGAVGREEEEGKPGDQSGLCSMAAAVPEPSPGQPSPAAYLLLAGCLL